VGGTAACNGYGGTADLSDGRFELGEFFITEMGCESAVMDAEAAYVAALFAATSWQLEADTLLLSGGGDLTFERRPPVPTEALVGTDWLLETLIRGDVASTTLGDPATLRLLPDGTVVGSTGCRALSGTWVVRDGRVFFPEFAADGECPNLLDQDNLIVNVLGDGFDAVVEGDRLTVTSAGSEGLVYRSG
jgi:heat shock protein HslJ